MENCVFGNLVATPLMHFSVLVVSFCWQSGGKWEDGRDRVKMEQRRGEAVVLYSPVTWSTRMREVIMRPY